MPFDYGTVPTNGTVTTNYLSLVASGLQSANIRDCNSPITINQAKYIMCAALSSPCMKAPRNNKSIIQVWNGSIVKVPYSPKLYIGKSADYPRILSVQVHWENLRLIRGFSQCTVFLMHAISSLAGRPVSGSEDRPRLLKPKQQNIFINTPFGFNNSFSNHIFYRPNVLYCIWARYLRTYLKILRGPNLKCRGKRLRNNRK